MKALLIGVLLAATTFGHHCGILRAAKAEDVCPNGNLAGATISVVASTLYSTDGCSLGGSVIFRCTSLPRGQNAASIAITNGEIARSGTLQIQLPTSNSAANNLVPLMIAIKGNTFGPLSQLVFSIGSLPPKSEVLIEGNTWMKLTSVTPFPANRLIHFNTLQVLSAASIEITGNELAYAELTNGTDAAAIFTSSVTLNTNSRFSVTKNHFDLSGYKTQKVYGFNADTFVTQSNSTIELSDNTFELRNGLAWLFPFINPSISASQSFTVNVQRNIVDAVSQSDDGTFHDFAYHQNMRGISIQGQFTDNQFTCVGCNGKWEWQQMTLSGTASMQFLRNTLAVEGGMVPQITWTYVEIPSEGVLNLADNILNATTQILRDKSPWLYFGQMTFKERSQLLITRNIFDAYYMPTRPSIGTYQFFFSASGSGDNAPRVYVCGNTLFGARPSSNDYIRLYMAANLANLLGDAPSCAKLYLPWNLTTDEPMDAGVGGVDALTMTTILAGACTLMGMLLW